MEKETFWTLFTDPAHWAFEIFLIILFDGLLGLIIWPRVKKFLEHYRSDDKIIHDMAKSQMESGTARPAESSSREDKMKK